MAAYRYWRINVSKTAGNLTDQVNITDIELRLTPGGTNVAYSGNGTASASSVSGTNYAANAFDQNAVSIWKNVGAVPAWVQWDFGAGNEQAIEQAYIYQGSSSYTGSANMAYTGNVQYSTDGSTWTTCSTFTARTNAYSTGTTHAIELPGSATAAITMPAVTLVALGGNIASFSMPAIAASGYCGTVVNLSLPMFTVAGQAGSRADITLPSMTVYAAGHDSTGENGAAFTLPMFLMTAVGGGEADIAFPAFTLAGEATSTIWGHADIEMPSMTVSGAATVSATADGSPFLSMPMFEMIGYTGAVCSVTLGGITTEATGTVGSVASAAITLPLFELVAEATAENYGLASITMPALVATPSSTAFLILPGFTLTAIGTATVAVTYEAYALNLNHKEEPRKQPVDELTRYTNYPFDKIVRYKNSYFGMNSTGLYLLEGTTDDGTAIAWDFKTHISDFGTAQKKTVEYAYFGGRMPAAVTVTLHVGETSSQAYSYTTPRGATAQNYRQPFGRGIKDRYYALEAAGSGELTVDTVTLNIATLARKV